LGLKAEQVQNLQVRVWHVRQTGAEDIFTDLAEEFSQTNPWGIQVQTASFEDAAELADQIQANLYGELPDLAPLYPYQTAHLGAGGGRLVDLAPYVSDPEWGFTPEERADFSPPFWDEPAAGGRRFGIPYYRLAQVLYYNEGWAEELGFDQPPATAQEFQDQACAAAQAVSSESEGVRERRGGWLVDTSTATAAGWLAAFGGNLQPSGAQGYALNTPETRQAFEYLRGLYDQGCAWSGENVSPLSEFAARQALFSAGSIAGLQSQAAAFAQAGRAEAWTVLPFPSPEGQPAVFTYGPTLSILKSAPERQLAAWLFLKWLVSPESQKKLVEATGVLPVRPSAIGQLGEYRSAQPQWAAALDLLPYARPEPGDLSWKTVRLVLSDAAAQLFDPLFQASQIPELIEMLDATAAEMYEQTR
jgi:ABC-type glycerol-3-phosphate transport system substrate-binding protein